MKSLFVKTLPLFICLFFATAEAQMSSPRPQYRSTASDSSYKETDEDAPKHLHQTVTIIDKKKLMPDGTYQTEKAYIHHRKDKAGKAVMDTTSQPESAQSADSSAVDTTTVASSAPMKLTIPTDTDDGKPTNMYLLYAAIGLIGLALLLALLLLLMGGRDKKRSPAVSGLQAVSAAAGLSLLLAYCICLSAFVCGGIVLLVAALTGAAVLTNDMNQRPNPGWLVGGHIVLTIVGLGIIIVAAFMH